MRQRGSHLTMNKAKKAKPRLLIDIKPTSKTDVFAIRHRRINLDTFSSKRVPRWTIRAGVGVVLIYLILLSGAALAPGRGDIYAQTDSEERAQLEAELAELEGQIGEYEVTIAEYRKQGSSLQGEISALQAKINKIALQIKAINLSLTQLTGEITRTSSRITDVESEIDLSKDALAALLRQTYVEDRRGLIEVLLAKPSLSDFFNTVNDLLIVQDSLRVSVEALAQLRDELINQKELLAMERADVESLKVYQERQRGDVVAARSQKDNLLAVTKGKESEYQKLLVATQKSAAEIRSRIFELIGGGQMSFAEAYEFAKYAEGATGVRAALILAVLDRESALGGNVGRCEYDKNPYYPDRASNPTTMHPTRDIPHFLAITKQLGFDPDTTLVSCPIPSDGAYGGAMGPAQFIPSTWVLYADAVSRITGSKPASPWRNSDAFIATGLLLKDNGAASNELLAAARYYCGWNIRYVCTNVYGRNVVDTAARFQQDINVLNS